MTIRRTALAALVLASTACGALVADNDSTGKTNSGPTGLQNPSGGSSSSSSGYGGGVGGGGGGVIISDGEDASTYYYPPPNAYLDAGPGGEEAGSSSGSIVTGAPPTFRSEAGAPLPPPVDGGGGYNAIYSASQKSLYLPMFSAPSCAVVPPFGESFRVQIENDQETDLISPVGAFPACGVGAYGRCYVIDRAIASGLENDERIDSGRFQLSAFDGNGIATGGMDAAEGYVPLVVKSCP